MQGSILEIKEVNYDARVKRVQLYVYAIAAKRYTFFRKESRGRINIMGADVNHFHLVSRHHSDPKKALTDKWIDIHTGHQYDVTTEFPAPPYVARIRTFGSLLERFMSHPESKSAGPDGIPSNRQTVGLLQRRHVSVDSIMYVGKETNRLEDVENGLVHDWSEVYSVYKNPAHEAWRAVLPQLKKMPSRTLAAVAGISTRAIKAIRNGHSVPSLKTRDLLLKHLKNT